jgi:phage-related protein (TIGR01555 family)
MASTVLAAMYRFDWVARKFIDIIADDATRKWIEFITDDVEVMAGINKTMDDLKIKDAFNIALINARLYGGSVLIPGINDGQTVDKPLNFDNIKSINHFSNVLDRWQIHIVKTYNDPLSADFGKPELYSLQPISRGTGFLSGVKSLISHNQIIHESRVIRFDGRYIPDLLRISNLGWNDSCLVNLEKTLKDFGVSIHSLSVLFMDFVTKVLKLPDLADLVKDEDGKAALEGRISFMAQKMSSIGIAVIGEGEDFDKKQSPVSGLDKLFDKMMEILSGATNIPRSRFFSQQLGKLAGATEENRKYYEDISSYQEKNLRNPTNEMLKMLLNDKGGVTKGKEPEDWNFNFNSLMEMDDKTRAEFREITAKWVVSLIDRGVITPEEVTASLFSPTGFSDNIIIDLELREAFDKAGKEETELGEEPEDDNG